MTVKMITRTISSNENQLVNEHDFLERFIEARPRGMNTVIQLMERKIYRKTMLNDKRIWTFHIL